MLFTEQQLRDMIPMAQEKNIYKFYEPLQAAMKEFHIDTPARMAAFIAQIAHESGSLYYVEELSDGSAYEYRKDLGNLDKEALEIAHANGTTTGHFYKGHGLLQITGYYNHKECGEALHLDLVRHPELLLEPLNACRSAAWFWNVHGLNDLADVGMFGKITHKINAGFNGAAERLSNYARCKKVLSCE